MVLGRAASPRLSLTIGDTNVDEMICLNYRASWQQITALFLRPPCRLPYLVEVLEPWKLYWSRTTRPHLRGIRLPAGRQTSSGNGRTYAVTQA